jgi:hypothetical protein
MGVVNTSYTFSGTDVITSSKLNNIIDETTFTLDAVSGSVLAVINGKITVQVQSITANELAPSCVTSSAILNGTITSEKMANGAVGALQIADGSVSTAKYADLSVITAKYADLSITTGKMGQKAVTLEKIDTTQGGTAPIFVARAFAKFNPYIGTARNASFKNGNYVAANGTIVTVTITDHGLRAGDRIRLVCVRTSGSGVTPVSSTFFTVSTVVSTSVFTVPFTSVGSSGTVIAEFIKIQASANISTASYYDAGGDRVMLNFATNMPNENYTTVGTSSSELLFASEDINGNNQLNTAQTCHLFVGASSKFANVVVYG